MPEMSERDVVRQLVKRVFRLETLAAQGMSPQMSQHLVSQIRAEHAALTDRRETEAAQPDTVRIYITCVVCGREHGAHVALPAKWGREQMPAQLVADECSPAIKSVWERALACDHKTIAPLDTALPNTEG